MFFLCSCKPAILAAMSDDLRPASPEDLADALAFALRFDGRKRKHDASEFMAAIVARRLVEHLERAGFVVMKRPPAVGASTLGRGYEPR
ncbi:MAG: hypothetical protein WAU78_14395 [Roseiarcus sp.]